MWLMDYPQQTQSLKQGKAVSVRRFSFLLLDCAFTLTKTSAKLSNLWYNRCSVYDVHPQRIAYPVKNSIFEKFAVSLFSKKSLQIPREVFNFTKLPNLKPILYIFDVIFARSYL